jgi:hypothetical protein
MIDKQKQKDGAKIMDGEIDNMIAKDIRSIQIVIDGKAKIGNGP